MNRDSFLDVGRWPEFPNWEKSDQFSQFESALSSIVSSPVSPVSGSPVSNEINSIRELIGKFGGGFSPEAITHPLPPPYSSTNSALVSSHPKLVNPNLPCFPSDPGFAERAARFSCFGSRSFNGRIDRLGLNSNKTEEPIEKFPRVSSSPALKIDREKRNSDGIDVKLSRLSGSAANSNTESSVSEQIPSAEIEIENRKQGNSRKRKGGSNEKKEGDGIDELKRMKKTGDENEGKTKAADPPKDYIHVRARRGQATDSHSLAERVRREKISERMKLLQNLVPNCNKVTGKALMLDEIINYVQSLQRQVEFLSMKLATINPSLNFDTNNLVSQNVNQTSGNLSHQTTTFYQQSPQVVFDGSSTMTQPVHEFIEPFSHIQGFDQDDLQSIVRMGFGENLDLDTSLFQTDLDQPSNMKIEL